MANSPYLIPPSGWRDTPLTASTDNTSFLRVANMMMPWLSDIDRGSVRTFLGADSSGLFKDYLGQAYLPKITSFPNKGGGPFLPGGTPVESPTQIQSNQKSFFQASQRAADAIAKMNAMRDAAKLTDDQLGPGFKFIKDALGILQQYGIRQSAGEQGITRAEFADMQARLAAMLDQASSNKSLAPYAEIASKFINPTGMNFNSTQQVSGNTVYGAASNQLFK